MSLRARDDVNYQVCDKAINRALEHGLEAASDGNVSGAHYEVDVLLEVKKCAETAVHEIERKLKVKSKERRR